MDWIQTKTVMFEDSAMGRQLSEVQKLRQDFDKYVADQAAHQAAEDKREKRRFWLGVLAGTIGSTVAGLIVFAVQYFISVFH